MAEQAPTSRELSQSKENSSPDLTKKEKLQNSDFTSFSQPYYNNKLNHIRSELASTKGQIPEPESLKNALFVNQILQISISAETKNAYDPKNKPKKR